MSTQDVGRPIRSQDLNRRNKEARERFDAAEQGLQEALKRSRMASLALQAAPARKPADTAPGNQHVLFRETVGEGNGAAQVGPFVAPRPTGRAHVVGPDEISGTGQLELLRPGALWAETDEEPNAEFEARLQPARRFQVDAVMIPHVAGSVDVTLFSPRTDFTVDNVTESRLIRFDSPRVFNGRIRVTSRSKTERLEPGAMGTGYIHALGGVELIAADWASSAQIDVPFQSPASGTITSLSARLRPGGETPSHALHKDGSEVSLPVSVSEGDPLKVVFTEVDGTTAASLARLALSIE